jgi:predicted CoA-substrate-specific enzyme activase
MFYIGINIGAITLKVVGLRDKVTNVVVQAHQGRPLDVLKNVLAFPEFAGDAGYYGVSGNLGHISEPAAIQRALQESGDDFNAVASLGGESFLVYILGHGRITNVLSHNKCAAGSGEFFVQQIGRMGLEMDEAIRRSFAGKVVPLASRCSVHCKSDITHKLNRHEASPEDILHTLHDSMANKVISLLEKGQIPLRRVLLIGGMTQNSAMVAALCEKLPGTEFVVLKESPWFEAWGTALLTRDQPVYRAPQFSPQPDLSHLPRLRQYADLVRVIPAPPKQPVSDQPVVLGVDAGSTTTKMTVVDSSTKGVVASYYTRTNGDPVAAIRECLHALVDQVGDLHAAWIGTTGSARELAGAYLGTEYVFNEISAHAAGAAHFDAEVDTIFEIGGQDSKYIHLRNGVPIDYAMNNACSAGTGSFLEESSQSDVGVAVNDISNVALAAPSPAHFKATCAAFINSDIRIAEQQGHTRENIVAGLVCAIADNYLNRVKGPRAVGKRVFLQGGVALNHAVGYAFARAVGRPVVIPPNPELLGALGVALLTLQRAGKCEGSGRTLSSLAEPEMKLVGRFTCGACKMYCSIDRFEVAGRRFPFGGRCSLYENVWKRKSRNAAAPDLVEKRADLLFASSTGPAPAGGERIGIPKALTTHSLYPLYSRFFSKLGYEVVLSGVDPRGDLKAYSGFCFPVQIAHGAIMDLARQNIRTVFMPHVVRMPQPNPCRDSYLCPITQAGPYFMAKAFPEIRFLSPLLDFTDGYQSSSTLVEMAVRELNVSRSVATAAWTAAVDAQNRVEASVGALGQEALDQALAEGKPVILLAGHSYSAFSAEGSQSVGKKLSSMGVTVIPADCLGSVREGPTPWHFANQILNAVALAKKHPHVFLLCVSNFSCTIDAFTHSTLAAEMGAKPYLILEIDAHTADAGVQTRLEAFLDIVRNYRDTEVERVQTFVPSRLVAKGEILRSNGELLRITDPRVKLYIPNFSEYHAQAAAMAARWMGLHTGEVYPPDRAQLERGLQHTSGRECLPLPVCIGQLLQVHERRAPGEIAGFYMVRGGAPCVMDSYYGYLERFIAEQRWPDIFLVDPRLENDYLGIGESTLGQHLSPAITVADILLEIEQVLQVAGEPGTVDRLREEWRHFIESAQSLDEFHVALPQFVNLLRALPLKRDPQSCPRVVVTGDFFTRFSPFFMEGIQELYASHGIILKPVDLSDLFLYFAYNGVAGAATTWNMKPGGLALAKACTRIFKPDGRQYLQQWIHYQTERRSDDYYRSLFRKTGLLLAKPNNVASMFEQASEHISPAIYGEIIPTVGKGLDAASEGYDGIILIGPFNCLPYRISEAILKPLCVQRQMPLLTYESDGYAVAPSVLRQVEVHIQQVLEHAERAKTGTMSNLACQSG